MRAIDLAIIVCYLAALLAIGLHFARRQKTTEEYFVAGRSVPWWAMGLSLLATIITSVTFIAYPGAAYAGEVAHLCRMSKGFDMLTMIRVPNSHRENIMGGAECGPDIIDVPMIENPEQVHEILDGARFPPLGNRGFFSVSRALNYSFVENIAQAQQQLNDDLCLMIQIETAEGVNRIEELAAIPGVDIFIGPSDLSASLGVPGQLSHAKVFDAGRKIIQAAKKNDKLVAVGSGPNEFGFYAEQGVDLLF